MYDVLPILGEGPAQALALEVGMNGHLINRRNLLSQHLHFALSQSQAAAILEVASWENDLKAHYAKHLQGLELEMAIAAMNAKGLLT